MTILFFNHQLSKPGDQMHAQLPMVAKIPYDHPMVTELG
jgi:hypothetical protein